METSKEQIESTEQITSFELNDILDTIVSYDVTKPWEVIIYQFILYCFRNFILKRIISSFDISTNLTETLGFDWDDLYSLCFNYCDPNMKQYLVDFFEPSHFEQIEDPELLEIFFKNFTISLDVIIEKEKEEEQEKFITFLDETLFNYFKNLLKESELYIFPENVDDSMKEELYRVFRAKEIEFIYKDLEYESIENITEFTTSKKSIGHALRLKKSRFNKTLKLPKTTQSKTLKNR
uniref:Uncharacterized protein n=1 Tax=viral metagenome TaxID=1070528 RepID=A0A6C0D6K8_9ZZZZ